MGCRSLSELDAEGGGPLSSARSIPGRAWRTQLAVAPYFLVFATPALLVAGALRGGAWPLAPLLFVFVLLPILDDRLGPDPSQPAERAGRRLFDLPLLLFVPVQLGVTVWVLHRLLTRPQGWLETAGLLLSLGVMNGSGGITIAHELVHRQGRFERALAEILMLSVSYPHFCVEHVFGHHKNVATPLDPASSRLGETVFAFVLRSVTGGLQSAWRLEADRLARGGRKAWGLGDRRLRYPLLLSIAYAGAWVAWDWRGLAFFVAQGLAAFVLLEVVNYLEHYGLARREVSPGRYERVQPEHSWNSSHRISNWYLFNLARHSDHHFLASRPYDQLRHHDQAPQLPAGYATMLLVALVPPLWFRVMNPRVEAWRERSAYRPEPSALAPGPELPVPAP